MIRRIALLLAVLTLAAPARAQDDVRPFAQVPLVPATEQLPDDVEAMVWAFWPSYYKSGGENTFGREHLRLGRIDLNGDDRAELVLMIDAPGWESAQGNPFVVAQWRKNRWVAVGWGWGDEDTVFATTETLGGWHSIDGGKVVMRWQGREYRLEDKATATP
ncbi:MAG: hypothetical protein ACM3Q1_06110 [Bacteroidales bacterium]